MNMTSSSKKLFCANIDVTFVGMTDPTQGKYGRATPLVQVTIVPFNVQPMLDNDVVLQAAVNCELDMRIRIN